MTTEGNSQSAILRPLLGAAAIGIASSYILFADVAEVTGLLALPLTELVSGTSINVTWVVQNNGAGAPFENYWQDRIYLSTLPVFTTTGATMR